MIPAPTARLRFREMVEADLDRMADLLGDPEVMRHYPRPRTRAEALEWIRWNQRNYAEHGYGLWVVETHEGEFVGDCGLTWQPVGDRQVLEVGYHTVGALQGRGYASEAARACLDLATGPIGESEVVAIINPANEPSRRVAEKIGLRLDQEVVVRGLPVVVYARRDVVPDPSEDQPLLIDSSPLPDDLDARVRAQLTFIAEADKLKTILRASPLAAVDRRENDAEHSWHLALMVLLLAEYADEPIDVGHAMQLVVVHDLVEIYAGDSPVFDAAAVVGQQEREEAAADRLFTLLPADQATRIRGLWDEFESGSTPEARFGKAMDRLEPMLLNWLNRGGTWQMPGATESTVRAREAGVVSASTTLGGVTNRLVEEGLQRGWIRPEPEA